MRELSFEHCQFYSNFARNVISTEYAGLSINRCKFESNETGIFRIWNDDDDLNDIGQTLIHNSFFQNSESIGLFRGPTNLWISNSIFENIATSGLNLDLVRGAKIDSSRFINIGGEVLSYLSPLSYLSIDFPIDGIFENVDTLRINNCEFIDNDSLAINMNYGRIELINTNFNDSRLKTRNAALLAFGCMFSKYL